MPVYFLSATPWEALICSPRSQNGGASQWNCARNSVSLCGSFYRDHGYDTDAHDTEIKPRICGNGDSESAYNESHLYANYKTSHCAVFNSAPCSQTPSIYLLSSGWDTTFRPYKKTVTIIVSCSLVFGFSDKGREHNTSELNGSKNWLNLTCL
jgi:hypothetical protein